MKLSSKLAIVTLGLAGLVGGAFAQSNFYEFYTIEANTDHLHKIDTFGNVVDIGGLGLDVFNPDLAYHQGVLYGIDQDARLFSIDTTTGQAGPVSVLTGTMGMISVEALASDGANLFVGFGGGITNSSMLWGQVDLLTNSVITISNVEDTDGAGFDGAQFWSIDSFWQVNNTLNVFSAGYPAPTNLAHGHPTNMGFGTMNENDVVASIPGSLFTIASASRLQQYGSGAGNLVASTLLNTPGGNYRGLEAVPEPGTICAAAVGLVGLVLRRRRRNRI